MQIEYQILMIACVLALVHVASASFAFKRQVGHAYTIGARDEAIAPEGLAGRLLRAQTNFQETFPVFLALLFLLSETQGFDQLSKWGCILYVTGRLAFLPLYAFGVVLYRTLAWKVATTGLALLAIAVFI